MEALNEFMFLENSLDNPCRILISSKERSLKQRFPVLAFDPQSDQDVGASANCRLGVLAVMLVASRTELIHHGQIVERLRPPLQGSGCIPDRAIARVRPDNL